MSPRSSAKLRSSGFAPGRAAGGGRHGHRDHQLDARLSSQRVPDLEGREATEVAVGAGTAETEGANLTSGKRPARLGQIVERPTFAEHKLLVAERKQTRVGHEPEVYGLGTSDGRKRPPGAGTSAIPKKVG